MYDYRIQYPNINVASFTPARFIRPEHLQQDIPVIRVDISSLQDCVPGDTTAENKPLINAVMLSAKINLPVTKLILDSRLIASAEDALSLEAFKSKVEESDGDNTCIYTLVEVLNQMVRPHSVEFILSRVGNWEQIQLLMVEGKTIMVGGSVYESFVKAEHSGVVPMPKPGEDLLGGHIVNLIAIDREQEIVVALGNMGPEFGDRGRLKIRDAYIRNLSICRDFFVLTPRGIQNAA